MVWGTEAGPARATMKPDELEKRELVMMCYLRHDAHRIVEDVPVAGGQRRVTVELSLDALTRRTNLVTLTARDGAWYVQSVDLEPLVDLCAARR